MDYKELAYRGDFKYTYSRGRETDYLIDTTDYINFKKRG